MNNSPDLRFYKIKDLFAIYRELLDYELINSYLNSNNFTFKIISNLDF